MADQAHIEEMEAQAALFALGALPADEATKFEQRLAAGCPVCQAEVTQCQGVVAALPLAAPAITPPATLKTRLFERIGAKPPVAAAKPADLTVVRANEGEWRTVSPGVDIRRLYKKNTMLVRMAPNSWLAEHDHSMAEQCLVLEGTVSSDGVTVGAGDFTYMPAGSHHDPLYSTDGCLLLIAYT
ncbi:MAG TPA: cupin domain-containing protein [Bryobacteraceae bacterium]|nr:cupin domain-containing protein [Bryobacteraceae bacterium]